MTHTAQTEKGRQELQERARHIASLEDQAERLKEEQKGIRADIADAYKAVQALGWNPAVLKRAVKELRMPVDERQMHFEFEAELDVYRLALGIAPVADQIVHEMTDAERDEATLRIAAGQGGVEAVKAAVSKRKAGDPVRESVLAAE